MSWNHREGRRRGPGLYLVQLISAYPADSHAGRIPQRGEYLQLPVPALPDYAQGEARAASVQQANQGELSDQVKPVDGQLRNTETNMPGAAEAVA